MPPSIATQDLLARLLDRADPVEAERRRPDQSPTRLDDQARLRQRPRLPLLATASTTSAQQLLERRARARRASDGRRSRRRRQRPPASSRAASRQRSASSASRSIASTCARTSASCEPTWTWRPSHRHPGRVRPFERVEHCIRREPELRAADARSGSRRASPHRHPGVTRIMARETPAAAARSGSSGASSTTSAPSSAASRSSSSDLLLPWTTSRSPAQSRGLRERELAERRDVRAEPLLGEQPQEGHVRERLRAVDDQRVARDPTKEPSRARGACARSRRRGAFRTRRPGRLHGTPATSRAPPAIEAVSGNSASIGAVNQLLQ